MADALRLAILRLRFIPPPDSALESTTELAPKLTFLRGVDDEIGDFFPIPTGVEAMTADLTETLAAFRFCAEGGGESL